MKYSFDETRILHLSIEVHCGSPVIVRGRVVVSSKLGDQISSKPLSLILTASQIQFESMYLQLNFSDLMLHLTPCQFSINVTICLWEVFQQRHKWHRELPSQQHHSLVVSVMFLSKPKQSTSIGSQSDSHKVLIITSNIFC